MIRLIKPVMFGIMGGSNIEKEGLEEDGQMT